jgi:hypothetical protein
LHDPNKATQASACAQAAPDAPLTHERDTKQHACLEIFMSEAQVAKESATTCLQANVALLQYLHISVPQLLLSIIEDLSQPSSSPQVGTPRQDAANGTAKGAVGSKSPRDLQAAATRDNMEMAGPSGDALDADDQMQFEDVEWAQEHDGVFEVVINDNDQHASSSKRRVPESIRQAISDALRYECSAYA